MGNFQVRTEFVVSRKTLTAALVVGLAPAILILGGCRTAQNVDAVDRLATEFVFETLAFSPVTATQAGYHFHGRDSLDIVIDDMSEGAIDRQRDFYHKFRSRIQAVRGRGVLNPQDRADLDIMSDQLELALLDLDVIQSYRTNPTLYVELAGNALYEPFVLEYAPKPERFRHIIARLKRIPALMDQARQNLQSSPEVWTRVAQEENEGTIALIDTTLRKECPPSLTSDFNSAAAAALDALRDFNKWLRVYLSTHNADWRLGRDKYARKFRYVLGTERSVPEVLAEAEQQLKTIREQMVRAAGSEPVEKALAKYAQKHATSDTYLEEAKRDLEETTRFVRENMFLPLPPGGNLQVIPTPAFMRGIYGVGGFSSAPPLEPKLGAYYWVTPIPADWPKARIESKLREYNSYGLKILTIHEAMPGHYVQAEYANGVTPESRRLLRAIYGGGPYVEGWAVYATEYLIKDGYYRDDPGMQLNWYKQLLRVVANTILDIRLQTLNMTEQEALDLMIRNTYQEQEEATAKYQRAQLSSCQLPTYFVGWRGWVGLREDAMKAAGAKWNESAFHDSALKTGPVPIDDLRSIVPK